MNYYQQQEASMNYGAASPARVSSIMKRVYVHMTFGLLVTALVALGFDSWSGAKMFFSNNSWVMWGAIIAEFAIVIGLSAAINKLSTFAAMALFYLFAVVNGVMLWPILKIYTGISIARTFLITAGTFGAMSVYGYFTDRDLSKFGSILFMALIGLVIASVVNIFLKSTAMMWVITFAGVIIFVGLTAWDTQQIKKMAIMAPADSAGRLACLGALNLYLDFINLFLFLLRIFGNSRD